MQRLPWTEALRLAGTPMQRRREGEERSTGKKEEAAEKGASPAWQRSPVGVAAEGREAGGISQRQCLLFLRACVFLCRPSRLGQAQKVPKTIADKIYFSKNKKL